MSVIQVARLPAASGPVTKIRPSLPTKPAASCAATPGTWIFRFSPGPVGVRSIESGLRRLTLSTQRPSGERASARPDPTRTGSEPSVLRRKVE